MPRHESGVCVAVGHAGHVPSPIRGLHLPAQGGGDEVAEGGGGEGAAVGGGVVAGAAHQKFVIVVT